MRIRNDAVLTERLERQFRKTVLPTRKLDQLGNPSDRADRRIVPFFEIDPRLAIQAPGGLANLLVIHPDVLDECLSTLVCSHHGGDLKHHRKNLFDAALIEHRHLDSVLNQIAGNVGL